MRLKIRCNYIEQNPLNGIAVIEVDSIELTKEDGKTLEKLFPDLSSSVSDLLAKQALLSSIEGVL